jgi:hypothetical protein
MSRGVAHATHPTNFEVGVSLPTVKLIVRIVRALYEERIPPSILRTARLNAWICLDEGGVKGNYFVGNSGT